AGIAERFHHLDLVGAAVERLAVGDSHVVLALHRCRTGRRHRRAGAAFTLRDLGGRGGGLRRGRGTAGGGAGRGGRRRRLRGAGGEQCQGGQGGTEAGQQDRARS